MMWAYYSILELIIIFAVILAPFVGLIITFTVAAKEFRRQRYE